MMRHVDDITLNITFELPLNPLDTSAALIVRISYVESRHREINVVNQDARN